MTVRCYANAPTDAWPFNKSGRPVALMEGGEPGPHTMRSALIYNGRRHVRDKTVDPEPKHEGRRHDDKVALVTGASSGIGRAIARRIADEGAKVIVADLQPRPRDGSHEVDGDVPTVSLIEAAGGQAMFVQTDVTRSADVVAAAAAAAAEFDGLDFMVNNAGIWFGHRTILEETEAEFDRTMATNIKGVWLGCKAAIHHMVRAGAGGSIINIASIAGIAGLMAEPAYSAAKGAVIGLTRQLAIDFADHRIRVNAVAPGFVETALGRSVFGDNPEHDLTPWPRLGTVSDVASAVSFLASAESEWITGTVLVVDGGYVAR